MEALADDRDFLLAVLDTVGALIVVLDRQGRIVRFNRACEETTDYRFDEVQGRPVWDFLLPPGDVAPVKAVFAELREGFAPSVFENYWVTKQGESRLIRWSNTALVDDSGVPEYVIGTGIDVTEHRETGERLQALVASAPVAIIALDPEGKVTMWNPAAERTFGWSAAEVLGELHPIVPPEKQDEFRALRQRVLSGEGFTNVEVERRRKDGSPTTVSVSTAPLRDAAGRVVGIMSVNVDVTEQKRVKAELARSEEIYREAIQALGGVPYRRNMITDAYEFVGAGVEQLLGIPPDQLTVQGLRATIRDRLALDPQSPADVLTYGEAFDRGEVSRYRADYRVVTPQGEEKWISDYSIPVRDPQSGQVVASLGILLDVTDRRRIEQELRDVLHFHELLIATIPSCLLVLDDELRIVMGGCRDMCLECGDQDMVIGSRLEQALPDCLAAVPALFELVRRVLERGGEEDLPGIRYVGGGREREVNIHVCGLASAGGGGEGKGRVLIVMDDVTVQRALEQQLHQAVRLESIGRLAGGVAHDFNNILTGISGYTEFLLQQTGLDDGCTRDLMEIDALAARATTLTRQLLAFSRRQALQPVVLDLNELIENTIKMLRRLIGEDVDLQFIPAADLGQVRVDPGQIEQVLVNLAVNARDAMPAGGKLTIETANVDLDPVYADAHVGVTPGPHVLMAVTDNGCGMDEATRERIFEPFFTTRDVGKGTGLGLATVYGIVKQHGGNVWAYSEPDYGTTLKVYLPAVTGETGVRHIFQTSEKVSEVVSKPLG